MPCFRFRSAISARTEGDPLPADITEGMLDAHLADCLDCRRWDRRMRALRAATDDLLTRRRRPQRAEAPPNPV